MTVHRRYTVTLQPLENTVMPFDRHAGPQLEPTAKTRKLSDGGGMYLLITPDGARYWRLDYRFAGKRRTMALGVYPTVTLASARTRREEARRLLVKGIDPNAV